MSQSDSDPMDHDESSQSESESAQSMNEDYKSPTPVHSLVFVLSNLFILNHTTKHHKTQKK